jgi:hypothetical protein
VLKYEVKQLHIESEQRYFLPLPKLNGPQLVFLREDLRARGFSTSAGERLSAKKGGVSLVIDKSGVASSSSDLMDAVVPSIPGILGFPKTGSEANPYFAMKRGPSGFELHLFLRLESLGRWTALRRQGDCGLTPDEALVLGSLLEGSDDTIECVTDYPVEGCTPTHIGRRALYRCKVPAAEFVRNLRTTSRSSAKNTYITRSSVLTITREPGAIDAVLSKELGEWCYLTLPKTSNP